MRLLEKQKALHLLVFSFFFFQQFFGTMGEFGAKQYFTDHRAADTIQLFVAIKENFFGFFFF